MKCYKIGIETLYDNNTRFRSEADGKYISNANSYFYRMRDGEIIVDAPIFDYFILRNYDESIFHDTHMQDVHSFIGEGSQILGWFVSEYLKLLLKNFKLPQLHMFYPSKLLYKKEKFDYYIFQHDGRLISNKVRGEYINWKKCILLNSINDKQLSINSLQEFVDEYRSIHKQVEYGKPIIIIKKVSFKQDFDFFPLQMTSSSPYIVSERLKQAIENAGITGFEFSELDYEVVVEK